MVSKASEDLPEPDSPVITTSLSRGRSSEIFLRLCSRAPRMEMNLEVILGAMSERPGPSARLSPGEGEPQEEGRGLMVRDAPRALHHEDSRPHPEEGRGSRAGRHPEVRGP